MAILLNNTEKHIIAALKQGLPATATPYADLAKILGIDITELVNALKRFKTDGIIRRIGAIANHFQLGLACGAMVAWQIEPENLSAVASVLASFRQVSHAYKRAKAPNWPYNFYTMVHTPDKDSLERLINDMSSKAGINNFKILETKKELKKTTPFYFHTSQNGREAVL